MVWFLEFQRQWYQRWSLNIMATSRRTQLYKVRTYCTNTGVPTKYKPTSETPDIIPVNMFEWNCCRLQPCAVHMVQSPISLSPEATDRKFFIPNKAFKTQIQIPQTCLLSYRVPLKMSNSFRREITNACAFHASVPRDPLAALLRRARTVSFLSRFHLPLSLPSELASQIWPKVAFDKWALLSTRLTAN